MEEASFTGRVGVQNDLEKLTYLLQRNCQRMQYKWDDYRLVAEKIISSPDYGFFIVVEQSEEIVGFVFFTFEWSDWRDGAFFWMQGLEVHPEKDISAVLAALKNAMDVHKTTLDYSCCGIRLCTPKVLHTEAEQAIATFDLKTSHY